MLVCGYVQWFIAGRAVAARLIPLLPASRRLRLAFRTGVVVMFLGLTVLGWDLVRAPEEEDAFISQAATIEPGMTAEEVRSILGEPRHVSDNRGEPKPCNEAAAVRAGFYWYQHQRLPGRLGRSGFVLRVCADQRGIVVERSTIIVD